MIDRRTHDLMALSSVQAYTHIAMECTRWAYRYATSMEDEARAKQIASIHDQLGVMYQAGLKEIMDAEKDDDPDGEVRSDDKDI